MPYLVPCGCFRSYTSWVLFFNILETLIEKKKYNNLLNLVSARTCRTFSFFFLFEVVHSLIISGVSYLSRSQEEEALKVLNSRYKDELSDSTSSSSEVDDMKLIRMSDVLFAERMKKNINEWQDELLLGRSGRSESEMRSNDSNAKFQTIFYKKRPAISLTGFTSRQLRLIQWVNCSLLFPFVVCY